MNALGVNIWNNKLEYQWSIAWSCSSLNLYAQPKTVINEVIFSLYTRRSKWNKETDITNIINLYSYTKRGQHYSNHSSHPIDCAFFTSSKWLCKS